MKHVVISLIVFFATAFVIGGIVWFSLRRAKQGKDTFGLLLGLVLAVASTLIVGIARRALEPNDIIGIFAVAGAFAIGFTLPVVYFGRRFLRQMRPNIDSVQKPKSLKPTDTADTSPATQEPRQP